MKLSNVFAGAPASPRRGGPVFISLDGVDGVGKSTVARLLAVHLGATYHKSPAGPFAAARRSVDLEAEPLVRCRFYAEACRFDSATIEAELREGRSVVCDRYVASTFAYHVALDARCSALLPRRALLAPHAAFLLTAAPEVRSLRLRARAPRSDAALEADRRFLDRVEAIFRTLGLVTVDTSGTDAPTTVEGIVLLLHRRWPAMRSRLSPRSVGDQPASTGGARGIP